MSLASMMISNIYIQALVIMITHHAGRAIYEIVHFGSSGPPSALVHSGIL